MLSRTCLAAAIVAACSNCTEPTRPKYSLAGHWYVTGAATGDFVLEDEEFTAGAIADSLARGKEMQASASGSGCSMIRWKDVDSYDGDKYHIQFGCISGGLGGSASFAALPDHVRSFSTASNTTGGVLWLTVK